MARVFAYCRVSTFDQTTENQMREIAAAGFDVAPKRIVAETVSGSVPTSERAGFSSLVGKLEEGDVLVVTKLDRLGRNAMDVRATVEALTGLGVRVHCLALGGVDLTSAAGKVIMGVLAAVAEFERDLLIERTQSGLALRRPPERRWGARKHWPRSRPTPPSKGSQRATPWLRWQRSSTRAGRPSCACATKPCKCAFERGPGAGLWPSLATFLIRSQSTASLTCLTPRAAQSLAMFPLAIARKT